MLQLKLFVINQLVDKQNIFDKWLHRIENTSLSTFCVQNEIVFSVQETTLLVCILCTYKRHTWQNYTEVSLDKYTNSKYTWPLQKSIFG